MMCSWLTGVFMNMTREILIVGLFLGILFFLVSLFVTTPFSDLKKSRLCDGFRQINFRECLYAIWIYGIVTALWEELFWRVAVQSFLTYFLGGWIAIIVTVSLFSAMHYHRFKGRLSRVCEFIVFSFVLSFMFNNTHNYWLVVLVHFCRNSLIVIYRLSWLSTKKQEGVL